MLASMEKADERLYIFREAAADIAAQVAEGRFAKADGVDELMDEAEVYGLVEDIGREEIERIVGAAFENVAKGNGADKQAKFDPRFKLMRFDDIKVSTAPNYLVKNILPREGLAVFWGPPKCCKSFLVFDMSMHVALGWNYRNHKVKQGAVVYLALEGGVGFHNRIEAWRRRHLQTHGGDVPFYLLTVPVDLIADHQKLIAAIKAQVANPTVVVLDTLNRSLVGDENKPSDMAAYIRASDAIRAAFETAVAIIHHCGIVGKGPRGHSSLTGAGDAQISIERDEQTGVITASVEHMKDGPPGTIIQSRLESVVLGDDDDGDPLTSCVIVPVEGAPTTNRPEPTGQAKIAFDLLVQALADHGEPAPASNHIFGQSRVVRIDLWRRYCDNGTVTKSDESDTKRKAFERTAERLQVLCLVRIWDGYVWLSDNRT